MKKLLVLMLVLGLVSVVQATVIDLVKVDIGQSSGRMGNSRADALQASDKIGLKIVVKYSANPDPSYSAYNGYLLSMMDLDLHVTGAASLSHTSLTTAGVIKAASRNANINPWYNSAITATNVAHLAGSASNPIVGAADLVWGFVLHCDGTGDVVVDLTLAVAGGTQYANVGGPAPEPVWRNAVEADLGDLTIYQVIPEPMTVALLGLGGLFLRRRK